VFDWLPANAMENDRLRGKVSQALESWRQTWFPAFAVSVSGLSAATGAASLADDETGWRLGDRSIALHCSTRAKTRLAEAAADVRLSDYSLKDIDRQLLDRFQNKLLDDLLSRLGSALGAPTTP